MKVYLPSPETDRQVEARGLRNDTNTQEERREKHLEPTGKMDTQWLEESCKHHTVVSVNFHCKAMQEAGSWQGDHARNGTETSGLLGGGHRLVKGGLFVSWGTGGKSQREVAMAAGWPCHEQNVENAGSLPQHVPQRKQMPGEGGRSRQAALARPLTPAAL